MAEVGGRSILRGRWGSDGGVHWCFPAALISADIAVIIGSLPPRSSIVKIVPVELDELS